ncbi:hypothetical protein J7399_14035 [Shimia sp. R9_1]|uniref:hypothetical protein n=1 Tax=Shimia sp. R9_1 TaxID=2821111 RepID=UPI001ADBB10F|nr:hypothetical protein [Shimia sp. R9_1]MBO9408556.1 hypothetical protein [Shimia sp. R9_1]
MTAEPILTHRAQGRNARSITVLILAVMALGGMLLAGTYWAIVAFLSLFALPTLVDVLFNPVANFALSEAEVRWKNATQEAEIELGQIKSIQIATRLNVAFRMTFVMQDGAKVRIPQDVLPPRADLEAALQTLGVAVEHDRLRLI